MKHVGIMELIARAPWREAVTYRKTWPHEYVLIKKDGQQALLDAFCARITAGEGVECWFFHQKREYLFLGGHKYWTMTGVPGHRPREGRLRPEPGAPVPRSPRLRDQARR